VSYWNGSLWVNIPEASVVGNNKVWRKFTFAPITTTKIRVLPQAAVDNGYSRLTEVEAWGTAAAPAKTNVASRANGAVATASSEIASGCDTWPARGANDGDRKGAYWGGTGGWADASAGNFTNDWLEIDFNGNQTIDEIDVFTLQDNYANPGEPTETTTFSSYGLTAFDASYWNGSSWVQIPETVVTGNNKVWRKFTFSAITTSKIRVYGRAAVDNGFSRIAEVEAWSPTESSAGVGIQWLVSDQLGTPRMILDETGALANMKRHDYLPFGEELIPPTGGRTAAMGYTSDGIRQRFTAKERDSETGLDYFGARYYSSTQGRFTSPDAPLADQSSDDPQSWNLYTYVRNNPLRSTDPDGRKMDGDLLEKLRNAAAGYGFQTDAEVKAETARRLCEIRHFTDSTTTPTMVHLSNPNTGTQLYLPVAALSQRQIWDISDIIRSGQFQIEEDFGGPEVSVPVGGASTVRPQTPNVTNRGLKNIVRDLFKGANSRNPIGTGSTADAVREELRTGRPVGGTFHSQKAREYITALENWLRRNPTASHYDRMVAQSLRDDLASALAGK
jgi:RHS repeat-associated protein